MDAEFAHHCGALCLVLVGLHLAFQLLWVVVSLLIGLGESVVENDARAVVAEPTKVCLVTLLFLNGYGDDFSLFKS